jgi:hypothetical protein
LASNGASLSQYRLRYGGQLTTFCGIAFFFKKNAGGKGAMKEEGKAESNSERTSLCRLPKISRYYTDVPLQIIEWNGLTGLC